MRLGFIKNLVLIANTKGEGKSGDDFWVKAETLLYTALIGYIDKKIERRIRIADDKEQRRFPVPDQVQLQLVIHGDLPHLFIQGDFGLSGPAGAEPVKGAL